MRILKQALQVISSAPRCAPGFSLIELSIVLVIMGTLAGLGLPLLTTGMMHHKVQTTHNHQNQVTIALAAYVLQHHKLPLPADPAAPDKQIKNLSAGRSIEGIIPYRVLGLREEVAKDGFKNWMTYVVSSSYFLEGKKEDADVNQYHRPQRQIKIEMNDDEKKEAPRPPQQVEKHPLDSFCNPKKGAKAIDLNLQTETGHSVLDNEKTSIAFILISHGPQGSGAYCVNGTRDRYPTLHPLEAENTNDDLKFITRPLVFDGEQAFTHRVAWETAHNLMAIHAKNPCPPQSKNP